MLSLRPKQHQVIQLTNEPGVDVIILIGSIETGKTYVAAHVMISLAYSFDRAFIPIVRLNKTTAKDTVYRTYQKVLYDSNLIEGLDYELERNSGKITMLASKSVISITEADHTKDRDHMKLKGLEANAMHIDEVDEIKESAYEMAQSRVGRDPHHPAPPITIVTMNPNNKWCKELFYDKWKKNELPDNIKVIEFTRYDSWSDQERYDKLIASRPKAWVERYVNNNWNYEDDIDSLFKYRHFDASLTETLDSNAVRYVGYDVARSGTDRSVVALWYGKTLVDIQVSKDKEQSITTDEQAMWLIKYLHQNAVLPNNADIDAVGIGVGVVDHMKSKGLFVSEFVSGSKPTSDQYDNLRSEVIYEFAQGMEKGDVKIYEGCPYRNELISEAMAHNHKIGDRKLAVESKDDVKKRTGSLSPDIFDAVVMGLHQQVISRTKAKIIF